MSNANSNALRTAPAYTLGVPTGRPKRIAAVQARLARERRSRDAGYVCGETRPELRALASISQLEAMVDRAQHLDKRLVRLQPQGVPISSRSGVATTEQQCSRPAREPQRPRHSQTPPGQTMTMCVVPCPFLMSGSLSTAYVLIMATRVFVALAWVNVIAVCL